MGLGRSPESEDPGTPPVRREDFFVLVRRAGDFQVVLLDPDNPPTYYAELDLETGTTIVYDYDPVRSSSQATWAGVYVEAARFRPGFEAIAALVPA